MQCNFWEIMARRVELNPCNRKVQLEVSPKILEQSCKAFSPLFTNQLSVLLATVAEGCFLRVAS
jgi:hypothetical protein